MGTVDSLPEKRLLAAVPNEAGRVQALGSSEGHLRCREPAGRWYRGSQAGLRAER